MTINNPHLIDQKDEASRLQGYREAIQTEWLKFIQLEEVVVVIV